MALVVAGRDDMVGLDAAILMHPRTWEASGHVENFSDPLVECRECNRRFRQDICWKITASTPPRKRQWRKHASIQRICCSRLVGRSNSGTRRK